MSVIQSTQPELRYIKRQNLDNEARIIGNYYRDLIRSYGIDCIYYKLNTEELGDFKTTVDKNTVLRHAYGYDDAPDYSMSAHTLAYMEVEQDIFQLNKFGLNPNMDVNFYFENNDFACALATKAGQFKEYPIDEGEVVCEVPECTDEYEEFDGIDRSQEPVRHYLSSDVFPYDLGRGYKVFYTCQNMSGELNVEISGYEVDKEYTIACNPYEHTDFCVQFDSNEDLYKSMKHVIENDDYVETMIFLTFKVSKVAVGREEVALPKLMFNDMHSICFMKEALRKLHKHLSQSRDLDIQDIDFSKVKNVPQLVLIVNYLEGLLDLSKTESCKSLKDIKDAITRLYDEASQYKIERDKFKYVLNGKLHGNVLFFDVNQLGKYVEKIHPSVGDVVEIDFPDENNAEKYEITDCFDKQLTQDGISPLLHKYVWKCKARKFINAQTDIEMSEDDKRLQEKRDHEQLVNEQVAKDISLYPSNEDAVYGGYELEPEVMPSYDKQDVRNTEHVMYEGLPEGQLIDVQVFECGSKLCTDGYCLVFMTRDKLPFVVAADSSEHAVRDAVFESGLKWLKATKERIIFVNIEGMMTSLAVSEDATDDEMNLEDLYNTAVDPAQVNEHSDSFIKFTNCRTLLFATADGLYAKLESDKRTYKLV